MQSFSDDPIVLISDDETESTTRFEPKISGSESTAVEQQLPQPIKVEPVTTVEEEENGLREDENGEDVFENVDENDSIKVEPVDSGVGQEEDGLREDEDGEDVFENEDENVGNEMLLDLLPEDFGNEVDMYRNKWPIALKMKKTLPKATAATLIPKPEILPDGVMCTSSPPQFVDEGVFLINRAENDLHHLGDILSDDTGAYRSCVVRHNYFYWSDAGPVFSKENVDESGRKLPYDLVIRAHYHKSTPTFKRCLYEIVDQLKGNISFVSVLQYYFTDGEWVAVDTSAVHGNAKESSYGMYAYRRLSQGCKDTAVELCRSKTPLEVIK